MIPIVSINVCSKSGRKSKALLLTNALVSEDIVVNAKDPVLVVVHVDDQVHGLGAVSLGVQLESVCDVWRKKN